MSAPDRTAVPAPPRVLELTAAYYPGESGWIVGEVLDARSVYSQGRTLESARRHLAVALALIARGAPHQLGTRKRRKPRGAVTETFVVVLA